MEAPKTSVGGRSETHPDLLSPRTPRPPLHVRLLGLGRRWTTSLWLTFFSHYGPVKVPE